MKCVVVGDGGAGKTCLLSAYARNEFPADYVPTVFDNYETEVGVCGCLVRLSLWDTAGQEDYDKLRPLSYPETDIFVVCFSVCNRPSFANVREKWSPEIRHHLPEAPILLVGTKCDLRSDQSCLRHLSLHGESPVTLEEAEKAAKDIGACGYVECSALTQHNVKKVFNTAVKCVLWPPQFEQNSSSKRKQRACRLQ